MASLESLSNPLERTSVLPVAVNAGSNPVTGSLVWDVARQYYLHDIVISGLDGGAYMFVGGASLLTAFRGGVDPALDTFGLWQQLSPVGVGYNNYDFADTVGTNAGGGAAWVFTAGNTFAVDEQSDWLVTFQGTLQNPAPSTTADYSIFTITGNGVGGTAVPITVSSLVDGVATTTSFSSTCQVSVGTGGTSITLTGVTGALAAIPALSGARLTITRLG